MAEVQRNIRGKKCQKRGNKKCIMFSGNWVYYTTKIDLAKKLNISVPQAAKYIADSGRRTIVDADNNVRIVNIKTDDIRGLLRAKYSIKRVNKKALISDFAYLPKTETTILSKLGPAASGNFTIVIEYSVAWFSGGIVATRTFGGNGIDEPDPLTGRIELYLDTSTAEDEKEFSDFKVFSGTVQELKTFLEGERDNMMQAALRMNGLLSRWRAFIYDTRRQAQFNFNDGYLSRDYEILEITQFSNIDINAPAHPSDHSCAIRFLTKKLPHLEDKIKRMETKTGVQITKIMEFAKKYNIRLNMYNEHGTLLKVISPGVEKEQYEISFIAYNGHFYGLEGKRPTNKKEKITGIKIVNECEIFNMMAHALKCDKLPSKITIDLCDIEYIKYLIELGNIDKNTNLIATIKTMTYEGVRYCANPGYDRAAEIFKKLEVEDQLKEMSRYDNVIAALEKKYCAYDSYSFFPNDKMIPLHGILYKSKELDKVKYQRIPINTDDKNKCYTYCLSILPYLLRTDTRTHKIIKYTHTDPIDNPELIDTHLYLAKPEEFTLLVPYTKYYAGYFLKKIAMYKIKYLITESIECDVIPNHFERIINLSKEHMTPTDFKDVFNKTIGKMECTAKVCKGVEYVGIYNNTAKKSITANYIKITDKYSMAFNTYTYVKNVNNRYPIANQVKDESRLLLFRRIKDHQLNDSDVMQINTDSISYINGKTLKDYDPSNFSGWKKSDFNELPGDHTEPIDIGQVFLNNYQYPNIKDNSITLAYAGAGKTTTICNKVIPEIKELKKSYIVLTPTHTTLAEYKNQGITCDIMQKYVYDQKIPDYDVFIIDEIGYIGRDCHNLLYRLFIAGKTLKCFGDFNQLQPVGESLKKFNQPYYLDMLFGTITFDTSNYRNTFKPAYYESLFNAPDEKKSYLITQVSKHSTKTPEDADVILCYTHKTRVKYNTYMLRHHGLKSWTSVGAKVICKTNKLLTLLPNDNVYNGKRYTITGGNKSYSKLTDSTGCSIRIAKSLVSKLFDSAYAINVHQIQGASVSSYYWCKEDNKYINGNVAYTVISRIKNI